MVIEVAAFELSILRFTFYILHFTFVSVQYLALERRFSFFVSVYPIATILTLPLVDAKSNCAPLPAVVIGMSLVNLPDVEE